MGSGKSQGWHGQARRGRRSAAEANHLEQTAARVVVLLVAAEVLSEAVDAARQQRDLDVGRTGVLGVQTVLLNERRPIGLSKGHVSSFSCELAEYSNTARSPRHRGWGLNGGRAGPGLPRRARGR